MLPLIDTGTAEVVMFMCPPAAVAANISALWPTTVNVSGRVRPLRSHAIFVPASAGADFTDQWLRMEACWRAARAYEHSHMALGFTHVLRARPELRWYRSIQPLASFHPHKVALKARSLTYPTPRKVPEAAFSSEFHCDPFFVYDGRHHGDEPVAYFGSRPWSNVSWKEIRRLSSVGSRNQTQVEERLAPIRRAIRRSGIPYATRARSLPPSSCLPLVPSRADPHWPRCAVWQILRDVRRPDGPDAALVGRGVLCPREPWPTQRGFIRSVHSRFRCAGRTRDLRHRPVARRTLPHLRISLSRFFRAT